MGRIFSGGSGYGDLPLSVAVNDVIPDGHSVFGPFGRLYNNSGGNITVSASPNPPTAASLQADGLVTPDVAQDYVAAFEAARTSST